MLKTVVRSAAALTAVASAAAFPPAAGATDAAELYNAPGQRHVDVCVRLGPPAAQLRYGDAAPTGFGLDDQRTFDDNRCLPGTVRLDLHELIPSTAGWLAFHRGGNGYHDDQNVKYGELATADINGELPAPVLSRGGRGAPCDVESGPAYRAVVAPIPNEMKYKRPQDVASGNNSGASFLHYGDPASDQGDIHDYHYSYLVWSFVNVRGGGIVRTLLKDDQVVQPCDVASITMDSWDRAGIVNGTVTARYVRILAGTCPVYGWMVWSHDYFGDTKDAVAHARLATGALPADPAADPSCPVQEDAQSPAVATSATTALGDSTATLAGTVDPAGAVGSYHFEYGTGPEYGSATPEAELGPDIAPLTVTSAGGLQPGTTYHYRLLATNSHGTTGGADATFTTTAPPPPERVVEQPAPQPPPPPPPVVALSGLKVTPATFKRSRSRVGSTTRIRWTASAPAIVTITFERKTTGIRVGPACRPLPHGGLPRRARKCTRWANVGGSLKQVAESGVTSLRFGGWIGRRPLARGTYRLTAVPRGDDARLGAARHAALTVR